MRAADQRILECEEEGFSPFSAYYKHVHTKGKCKFRIIHALADGYHPNAHPWRRRKGTAYRKTKRCYGKGGLERGYRHFFSTSKVDDQVEGERTDAVRGSVIGGQS